MSIHAQSETQTVGEIASALAGATAVFRKHKIDFCCGGGISLEEAARNRGIDPAAVRADLDGLARRSPDAPTESAALCDHIVDRYHDVHRREFRNSSSSPTRSRPCIGITRWRCRAPFRAEKSDPTKSIAYYWP